MLNVYCTFLPFICFFYPLTGHPIKILRGSECSTYTVDATHEGFIFARFIPPDNIYCPVLPVRVRQKLIFPLCYTCARDMQTTRCKHTLIERSIIGVYPICEIRLALAHGYRIFECIEVWLYDTIQYDANTGSEGIFSKYMRTFCQLKQQSSGWPQNCETEEQRSEYIRKFFETEGILLDKDKIESNPSMRQICKLFLNSVCLIF